MIETDLARRRHIAHVVLLAAIIVAAWMACVALRIVLRRSQVTFLAVGDADCAVVHGANGKVMVLGDGGPRSERILLPYLLAKGVRRVDAVLLSDGPTATDGCIMELLTEMPVRWLFVPHGAAKAGRLMEAIQLAHDRGATVCKLVDGTVFQLGRGCCVESVTETSNNLNCSAVKVWCGRNVLVIGDHFDIESPRPVGPGSALRADVLKLPDMGRASPGQTALLDNAQPRLVLISADGTRGKDSPGAEVVQQLLVRNLPVFRTDTDGAITVTFRPSEIRVSGRRGRVLSLPTAQGGRS